MPHNGNRGRDPRTKSGGSAGRVLRRAISRNRSSEGSGEAGPGFCSPTTCRRCLPRSAAHWLRAQQCAHERSTGLLRRRLAHPPPARLLLKELLEQVLQCDLDLPIICLPHGRAAELLEQEICDELVKALSDFRPQPTRSAPAGLLLQERVSQAYP